METLAVLAEANPKKVIRTVTSATVAAAELVVETGVVAAKVATGGARAVTRIAETAVAELTEGVLIPVVEGVGEVASSAVKKAAAVAEEIAEK